MLVDRIQTSASKQKLKRRTVRSICRVICLERVARSAGHTDNVADSRCSQVQQPALRHPAGQTQRHRQFPWAGVACAFEVANDALVASIGKKFGWPQRLGWGRPDRRRRTCWCECSAPHKRDRKQRADATNHLTIGQGIEAMNVERAHTVALARIKMLRRKIVAVMTATMRSIFLGCLTGQHAESSAIAH